MTALSRILLLSLSVSALLSQAHIFGLTRGRVTPPLEEYGSSNTSVAGNLYWSPSAPPNKERK